MYVNPDFEMSHLHYLILMESHAFDSVKVYVRLPNAYNYIINFGMENCQLEKQLLCNFFLKYLKSCLMLFKVGKNFKLIIFKLCIKN